MRKLRYLIFAFLPAWWCPAQTAAPPAAANQPTTIATLQQQAAQQPPVKGASRQLGIAYYRNGKLIDAERAFAAAMAQDPADLESVQMRGLTLYRLGQPAAAIPYLERVRQWMPDANADANHVLGLAYMQCTPL